MTSNLYPNNNILARKLSQMDSQISRISLARQPYQSDWYEVSYEATATAAGVITFSDTSFVPNNMFNVGDKIRLKQGGAYKYFYVIKTSATSIKVFAGVDYSTTAAAVTNLALSRISNPVGHPGYFLFASTLQCESPMTVTQGTLETAFFLQGNICFFRLNRYGYVIGGTPDYNLVEDLPIECDYWVAPQVVGYGGATPIIAVRPVAIWDQTTQIIMAKIPLQVYDAGINEHNFSTFYKIKT